jgi:hypothetical protein
MRGNTRESDAWGTPMSTVQAIILGMVLAWTPIIILLAFLIWREGNGLGADRTARLRSLFASHGLEFEDGRGRRPHAKRRPLIARLRRRGGGT